MTAYSLCRLQVDLAQYYQDLADPVALLDPTISATCLYRGLLSDTVEILHPTNLAEHTRDTVNGGSPMNRVNAMKTLVGYKNEWQTRLHSKGIDYRFASSSILISIRWIASAISSADVHRQSSSTCRSKPNRAGSEEIRNRSDVDWRRRAR